MFESTEWDYDQAIPEIGEAGTDEIRTLRNELYGGKAPSKWRFRYAPSIITRCEAQLFNFSIPRFALRVYLDDECESFINARRLDVFCDQATHWARRRKGARWLSDVKEAAPEKPPSHHFRGSTPIADSLLRVPPDIQEKFHVLDVDLGLAYGEGKPMRGSPYAKHVPLAGGGLCAQAACFMATALLHDECSGMYGIGEITALVTPSNLDEILLKGLTHNCIQTYFRNKAVGLWACRQHVSGKDPAELSQRFAAALRAYVLSDMPVVLPLDSSRMAGSCPPHLPIEGASIYGRNGMLESTETDPVARRHAVLVVGCSREGDDFLVHDPSSRPFLVASASQLIQAAPYHDTDMTSLIRGVMVPATPAAAKMPIYDGRVQTMGVARYELSDDDLMEYGGFRLTRLERAPKSQNIPAAPDGMIDTAVQRLVGERVCPEHWCWLSVEPSQIRLWDAQTEPDPEHPPALIWQARRDADGWRQSFDAKEVAREPAAVAIDPAPPAVEVSPCRDGKSPLSLGVISSFVVTGGLDRLAEVWPDLGDDLSCEFYAFMQRDAESLLGSAPVPGRLRGPWRRRGSSAPGDAPDSRQCVPALDRMAAIENKPLSRWRLARIISERLGGTDKGEVRGVRLSGLATFAPEVIADNARGELARKALRGLVRLAGRLRRRGHPLKTVEVVSGSLAAGIFPGVWTPTGERVYVANRLKPAEGRKRLLRALASVAKTARKARVVLSVELEPGPFAVLNGWETLLPFCRQVQRHRRLREVIGLNLDVAHWVLAGIGPDLAPANGQARPTDKERKIIRDRIAHAHISDHGRGHMADAAVLSLKNPEDVKPWLDLLADIRAERSRGDGLPYEGSISIEMEACRALEMIKDSVRVIRQMTGGHEGTAQ